MIEYNAIMTAIQAIKDLDTCREVYNKGYEDGVKATNKDARIYVDDVLDKIRVEIEQTTSRYTISRERGAMGQVEWSDRLIKESEVLAILDKYKVENG